MHNLSNTVSVLRDAETIVRSRLISDREERLLLNELVTQLPVDMLPSHAALIINAIGRYNARPRKGPFDANATRPTEGRQDTAPVGTGPGEATAEATQGPTEGKPEQADDAGGVSDGSDGDTPPAQATAPDQKPKPAKAGKR
jgi:hypothetical protein